MNTLELAELPTYSPIRSKLSEEPRGSMSNDNLEEQLKSLAAAVVRSAVIDLDSKKLREEAKQFLLRDLWDDCLWLEILGELPRSAVEKEVTVRLQTGYKRRSGIALLE